MPNLLLRKQANLDLTLGPAIVLAHKFGLRSAPSTYNPTLNTGLRSLFLASRANQIEHEVKRKKNTAVYMTSRFHILAQFGL